MAQAFQGVVVQVDVREFDFALVDRFGIHREVVIVRGDLHLAGWSFAAPGDFRRGGRT